MISSNLEIHSNLQEIADAANIKGYLYKKSTNTMVKKWLYRYFSLGSCKLIYSNTEEDSKQRGVFDFNQLSVSEISSTQQKYEIKISFIGSEYILRLRTINTDDLSRWVLALNLNISCSLGMRKEITLISCKKKFWRYQRVSDYYLRRFANTGDILLFTSKGFGAKMQRGITGGKYDHIALIMSYASGKVILLEATEKEGVACLEWDYFIKMNWNSLYSRLVYRSLNTNRTPDMIDSLKRFVKNVNGKKFGINPKKLIGKSSEVQPGTETNFFCSELVASAYKAMGVFPNNVKSSKFWPSDFINDEKLPFISASLGQEMLIDFDL